jgi:hypothetical protein
MEFKSAIALITHPLANPEGVDVRLVTLAEEIDGWLIVEQAWLGEQQPIPPCLEEAADDYLGALGEVDAAATALFDAADNPDTSARLGTLALDDALRLARRASDRLDFSRCTE